MNDFKKIYSLDDFEDEQIVYLKTRGSVAFEKHHFGSVKHGSGFRNNGNGYHPYSSVFDIPELMQNHGFFLNENDYIEWKTEWSKKNICGCCQQYKPYTTDISTGKEVYLKQR